MVSYLYVILKLVQITLRHDVSRIVQCIIQYGKPEQRTAILAEFVGKIVEMSKTPYGHFVGTVWYGYPGTPRVEAPLQPLPP